jgi:hypothetical protein
MLKGREAHARCFERWPEEVDAGQGSRRLTGVKNATVASKSARGRSGNVKLLEPFETEDPTADEKIGERGGSKP